MNNYDTALNYLETAAKRGSRLGLERITALMHRLGDPQEKIKIIHVAGTNGKGSFSAMLSAILTSAGFRTGGFSSPALTGITDSFRINCTEITPDVFGDVMHELIPQCEAMEDKPTEFEVLTAAAYMLFLRENCDIAIVECGMGGDTDSTNVITAPLLSVITNVQKDHTGFLGNTIAEIAAHKAGIIKSGRPVVTGADGTALEVITEIAKKKSAELICADTSRLSVVSADLSGVTFRDRYMGELKIPLLGTYQSTNTALVLSAVEILRDQGFDIPMSAVIDGLNRTRWHGRFELLRSDPYVIYDGAHNPDGIRCAADSIRRYFPDTQVVLLIGVMADKEYTLYADMLGSMTRRVFAVKPDNPRALDSEALADMFTDHGIDAEPYCVLSEGVKAAYSFAKAEGLPLIALGSLYMYREFTDALDRI